LCKTFQIAKNKYNISIIGLTQTSRLPPTEKTAERYYNIPPALDESRESSEIENSADVMISIARPGGNIKCKPELKDKLVLHLAKDRDQSDPNVNAQPFLLKMQSSGILIDSGEGF
jgi:replicative DNA helicase